MSSYEKPASKGEFALRLNGESGKGVCCSSHLKPWIF